jgi:ribosomal protein S18 acetylase RimI-like enzyme
MVPTTQAELTEVRAMGEGDEPRVADMYRSYQTLGATLGLPPADAAEREEWLETLRRGLNLVASADGRVEGHLAMLSTGGAAEIVLFVHQDFRGRGLGTKLLREAIDAARQAGYSYVWLLVAKTNFRGQRLLRKLRFRVAWEDLHEMQFMLPTG